MSKFTGNIIRLPAVTPTQNSASGVYTLDDQFTAQSSGTWPIVRDQYFNYTTLLLTGAVQGTAYPNPVTQPYSFLSDASTNNFVVSPNGDVSARPFNPYLNNYSNRFDGSSGQLAFPTGSFVFGNSDFTIEAWVYNTGTVTGAFFHNQYTSGVTTTSMILAIGSTSNFDFYVGSSIYTLSNVNLALNQWVHLACVRTGGTISIFQNGTRTHTRSDLSTLSINAGGTAVAPQIGNSVNGYMSNHRIIIGSGPYDATQTSITVPTTPLTAIANTKLLTCQANRFIDTNTQVAAKTITVTGSPAVSQNSPFVSYDTTNGSGYFDGTGDYLNAGSSSSLACGSGSFTVETWIYPSVLAQSSIYASTANGGQFFSFASGQGIGVGRVNVAWDYSTNVFPVYYAWNHIVWVRSGSNLSIYLNGTRIGNTTNSQNYTLNGGSATIGTEGSIASTIPGCYISNFRVAPGTAIYDPTLTTLTNTLTGATGVPTAPLPVVSGTSLLTLQTRAPATNNGFIDSSPNNFVVTRNGNTTQGSFSPFSPTGWSNLFNGSNNGFTVPASSAFSFAGEFTWEAFVCFNAALSSGGYAAIAISRGAGASTSSFQFFFVNDSGTYYTSSTLSVGSTDYSSNWSIPTPTVGVWYHVALVRDSSNNLKLYWNGSQRTLSTGVSSASGTTNTPSVAVSVGYRGGSFNDLYFNGYISNLRMVASALYSGSSITIPTAPFSPTVANTRFLTCQSNRFAETAAGMAVTTINTPSVQAFSPFAPAQSYIPSQIGGSGYFDGNGDYLTSPSDIAFAVGTGDFTLEAWAYWVGTLSVFQMTGSSNDNFNVYFNGTTLSFYNGTVTTTISGLVINKSSWNHIALVRASGTAQFYLNGVAAGSGFALSTNWSTAMQLAVGRNIPVGTGYADGYISGFRFVKGTAVYTSSFPIPTAPPTAIPNTSLLLNFTNGGIVDATGKNNLETVANSGVQTSVIKYGNGSMYFDGGTDCLFESSSTNYGYGSGDFTIEFWLRLNNTGTQTIVSNLTTASSVAPHIYYQVSSNIRYFTNGADRITGSALNANQWYHIAVCRFSSNTKMFVDGSQVGSTYPDTNNYGASNPLGVGDYGVPLSGVSTLNGYISNLRITKYARYTTNFNTNLPPGPFPLG